MEQLRNCRETESLPVEVVDNQGNGVARRVGVAGPRVEKDNGTGANVAGYVIRDFARCGRGGQVSIGFYVPGNGGDVVAAEV